MKKYIIKYADGSEQDCMVATHKTREEAGGEVMEYINSHRSLDTCKEILAANDLSGVHNIVLIHLSDANANAVQFQEEIQRQTLKTVNVASSGMIINFNKSPF